MLRTSVAFIPIRPKFLKGSASCYPGGMVAFASAHLTLALTWISYALNLPVSIAHPGMDRRRRQGLRDECAPA
jgi:hypothetical protein